MAVLFCKELGLSEVIFEGDAAQVISDINSPPPPHFSKAGHITECIIGAKKDSICRFCSCTQRVEWRGTRSSQGSSFV
jgi:hypothetical protein